MSEELKDLRNKYFVSLKPIDDESKKILSHKEYKNNKSVIEMWRDSVD